MADVALAYRGASLATGRMIALGDRVVAEDNGRTLVRLGLIFLLRIDRALEEATVAIGTISAPTRRRDAPALGLARVGDAAGDRAAPFVDRFLGAPVDAGRELGIGDERDRPDLAIRIRDRAALRVHVADAVGVATGAERIGGGLDLVLPADDLAVRLLPDVEALDERVPGLIDDPVLPVVPAPRHVDRAEDVPLPGRDLHRLVVGRLGADRHLVERGAERHLLRAAADRGIGEIGAGIEIAAREQAVGDVVAPPIVGVGRRRRLEEPLRSEIEIALTDLGEARCVPAIRVVLVKGDRLEVERASFVAVAAVVEEGVGVGDEVARPVDPHVLALVPSAIGAVLLDDVELFAGDRVVALAHVEVRIDRPDRDDETVVGLASRTALPIGGGDELVGVAGDEELLGDLEANPAGEILNAVAGEGIGPLHREHEGAHVELGRVGRVAEVADQIRFVDRVRLHSIDRRALARAARGTCSKSPHPGGHGQEAEPSHPIRSHGPLVSFCVCTRVRLAKARDFSNGRSIAERRRSIADCSAGSPRRAPCR